MKSLIFICIIFHIAALTIAQKKVVCYWGTWAGYRYGNGLFEVTNINPHICTHIVYTFFGATGDGKVTYLDPWMDLPDGYGKDYIRKFIALKNQNPNVKLLAAIGGWNAGSAVFSQIAATEATRYTFAQNILKFLQKHSFDGFDFDWEYPALRGGNTVTDKANFILLLAEIKRVLSPYQLLFTIAVGACKNTVDYSYDVPGVVANVDFINLMTYDLHGSWDGYLGINAPLYAGPDVDKELNVDTCVEYWLAKGAPANHLILGIPLYGKSFTLLNENEHEIGDAITGDGYAGRYTSPQTGFIGYNEICENNWPRFWQPEQFVPYAINGNQWVGYDDAESIAIKSNYLLAKGLGGIMFWSIETDDFRGICGQGTYPLITTGYNIMMKGEVVTTTAAPTQSTTTTQKITTQSTTSKMPEVTTTKSQSSTAGSVFICPTSSGSFRDPHDCTKFYVCQWNIAYLKECPGGLYFDENLLVCNWPYNVPCSS